MGANVVVLGKVGGNAHTVSLAWWIGACTTDSYRAVPVHSDCTFQGNRAAYGGGIASTPRDESQCSRVDLTRCTFTGNQASVAGGATSWALPPAGVVAVGTPKAGAGACDYCTGCTFTGNVAAVAGMVDYTDSVASLRVQVGVAGEESAAGRRLSATARHDLRSSVAPTSERVIVVRALDHFDGPTPAPLGVRATATDGARVTQGADAYGVSEAAFTELVVQVRRLLDAGPPTPRLPHGSTHCMCAALTLGLVHQGTPGANVTLNVSVPLPGATKSLQHTLVPLAVQACADGTVFDQDSAKCTACPRGMAAGPDCRVWLQASLRHVVT